MEEVITRKRARRDFIFPARLVSAFAPETERLALRQGSKNQKRRRSGR